MILDDIVKAKRREIADLKRIYPLSKLTEAIRDLPPARDFRRAIGGRECAIIAEIKRRSPSRGLLVQDFDPGRIASVYEKNGAAAISVLTDGKFFAGDRASLGEVREIVTLPLLRKDFIIDPYQIYETRVIGADAILFIAGLLKEKHLKQYMELAETLGLSPLVEVHTRKELALAVSAGAGIIGINNRNLKTFSTDLKISLDLAPHILDGEMVISESGIHTRSDVEILMGAGIHAFLVGESLMTAGDTGAKLRELLGS